MKLIYAAGIRAFSVDPFWRLAVPNVPSDSSKLDNTWMGFVSIHFTKFNFLSVVLNDWISPFFISRSGLVSGKPLRSFLTVPVPSSPWACRSWSKWGDVKKVVHKYAASCSDQTLRHFQNNTFSETNFCASFLADVNVHLVRVSGPWATPQPHFEAPNKPSNN